LINPQGIKSAETTSIHSWHS